MKWRARKATTGHLLPFSQSAQTANTVKKTVTCTECDKPRVIYSATRLNINEQILLDKILDIMSILVDQNLKS